jgi:hypothetical protein
VIGVPTSVGYGFGSDGVAALASMLQSCTPGLSVVNIDNGIGAGAFAALISNQLARATAAASASALAEKGTGREKVTRMATRIGEQQQQQQKQKQKQQQKEQRRRKTKEGQSKASHKKAAGN